MVAVRRTAAYVARCPEVYRDDERNRSGRGALFWRGPPLHCRSVNARVETARAVVRQGLRRQDRGYCVSLAMLVLGMFATVTHAVGPGNRKVADAEHAFLDYMDAVGAVGYLESGATERFEDKDRETWTHIRAARRKALDAALAATRSDPPVPADQRAIAAMRKSIATLESDDSAAATPVCQDAQRRDLDFASLRAALVSCFVEHGNQLRFEGRTIDRGTALQLLHVVDEPARRKALFDAFNPLWGALNGRNETESPYRRMIALAAADAKENGSEVDAAARAIGVPPAEVERWLLQILAAWRDANPPDPIEPWDFRYVNGAANRQLEAQIPAAITVAGQRALLPRSRRRSRPAESDLRSCTTTGKSPLAYSDFLTRGRLVRGEWRRPIARVLGTYPTGGLFSLNELIHETGHAVHVSAIHTRAAYMDWPDTLFAEAFADVPAWSVHEPAWQRRYLGTAVPEAVSMRALFSNVMLDIAWSLFEMRLLRDPAADPNAVWTDITHEYLRIVPHPEVPWWAMRVQLAGNPGYMVNYGLGAVLTAEIRARAQETLGGFDAGNSAWYGWTSERLLRFGSERDTLSSDAGPARPAGRARCIAAPDSAVLRLTLNRNGGRQLEAGSARSQSPSSAAPATRRATRAVLRYDGMQCGRLCAQRATSIHSSCG